MADPGSVSTNSDMIEIFCKNTVWPVKKNLKHDGERIGYKPCARKRWFVKLKLSLSVQESDRVATIPFDFNAPDTSCVVCTIALSVQNRKVRHIQMVRRVLRYRAETPHLGIVFSSTTGFFVKLNWYHISWKSVLQSIVALSSDEAEYITMSITGKELGWIRILCWEIAFNRLFEKESILSTIPLHSDNTAVLSIANQDGFNSRTKNIAVKYQHIRNLRASRILSLRHVRKSEQVAGILTKPVKQRTTQYLC